MRPLSIILLILAALLLIGGTVLAGVAVDIAETDGYELFDTGSGHTILHDLSGGSISKIELSLKDTKVFIHGDSENAYVELVNFPSNMYNFSQAEQILSFDEVPGITSLLGFKSGFSFKGLRHLLRSFSESAGPREIHIHLTPETVFVKNISITATDTDVYIENMVNRTDIVLTADRNATVTADGLLSNSALSVTGDTVTAKLNTTALYTLSVTAKHSTISSQELQFTSLDISTETGTTRLHAYGIADAYRILLDEGDGRVQIDGVLYERPYESEGHGEIKFSSPLGDLTLLFTKPES